MRRVFTLFLALLATNLAAQDLESRVQRLQFVGKYDTFDPSDHVANDALHTTTLGINYFIHRDDLKLQIDWLKSEDGHRVPARLQTIF